MRLIEDAGDLCSQDIETYICISNNFELMINNRALPIKETNNAHLRPLLFVVPNFSSYTSWEYKLKYVYFLSTRLYIYTLCNSL